MVKKLLFIPPILIGIVVLYFSASGRQAPERISAEDRARPVRVITVAPVHLVPRATGFGSVYPATVWSAIAQVSGEVVYVHPDLERGAILAAGSELARISPTDFELAVNQAQANIRSAEAKLAESTVTEMNTKELLAIEVRGLELREGEIQRQIDLRKRGSISQSALDLERRGALTQRKKVQDLENTLRLLPTQRSVQREQIAVYRVQLKSAQLDLARTRITLPFQARIAVVNLELNQYIQTGSTLVTADGLDVAEVEAQIPISRFRAMVQASAPNGIQHAITAESLSQIIETLGFEATVRLATGKDFVEWPARFDRISDTIDPKTRTIGAIVAVHGAYAAASPGRRPPLTKGMFVQVEVRTRARNDRIVVPRAAVHEGNVYVLDSENRLEIRPITLGLIQGNLAVVESGIEPGEHVIVSDLVPAVVGMRLRAESDALLTERLAAEAAGTVLQQ